MFMKLVILTEDSIEELKRVNKLLTAICETNDDIIKDLIDALNALQMLSDAIKSHQRSFLNDLISEIEGGI